MSEQDLPATRPPGARDASPSTPRPSATRSISNRRSRRVELIRQGRPGAWQHGTFSVVANAADVSVEHALVLASHPTLDPVADHRLIEDLCLARVQRNRALLAIEAEGMSTTLTSYLARLMPLVERLERAVHERARERVKDFRRRPLVDLAAYAATDRSEDDR